MLSRIFRGTWDISGTSGQCLESSGTNEKSHGEYKGCAGVLRDDVIVSKRFFMLSRISRISRGVWDIAGTTKGHAINLIVYTKDCKSSKR